ncbi:IclR family transcriptional regulator [Euzebya sp.]|uniref:IclR family transcriptional regulator n=1 Tax=Euzebya sp. TaxID=1971409 RepID=UPI003511D72A
MDAPSDLIQSVSRALRILEVVGQHPEGVAPKVIAHRAGLKLSTTYHLLRTLAYEDYLARTAEGDYALGLSIADRFADLRTALDAPAPVARVLRHLAEGIGHSVYLARFVEGRVAITSAVEGPGSPHLEDLIPGFDEAAHATALGKALLSRLPRAARDAYLVAQGLPRFTRGTVIDLDELSHELALPVDGVFVEEGQFSGDVSCAAALVDPAGRPEADPGGEPHTWWAVAVSASSDVFARRRGELTAALVSAAGDLAVA